MRIFFVTLSLFFGLVGSLHSEITSEFLTDGFEAFIKSKPDFYDAEKEDYVIKFTSGYKIDCFFSVEIESSYRIIVLSPLSIFKSDSYALLLSEFVQWKNIQTDLRQLTELFILYCKTVPEIDLSDYEIYIDAEFDYCAISYNYTKNKLNLPMNYSKLNLMATRYPTLKDIQGLTSLYTNKTDQEFLVSIGVAKIQNGYFKKPGLFYFYPLKRVFIYEGEVYFQDNSDNDDDD